MLSQYRSFDVLPDCSAGLDSMTIRGVNMVDAGLVVAMLLIIACAGGVNISIGNINIGNRNNEKNDD